MSSTQPRKYPASMPKAKAKGKVINVVNVPMSKPVRMLFRLWKKTSSPTLSVPNTWYFKLNSPKAKLVKSSSNRVNNTARHGTSVLPSVISIVQGTNAILIDFALIKINEAAKTDHANNPFNNPSIPVRNISRYFSFASVKWAPPWIRRG